MDTFRNRTTGEEVRAERCGRGCGCYGHRWSVEGSKPDGPNWHLSTDEFHKRYAAVSGVIWLPREPRDRYELIFYMADRTFWRVKAFRLIYYWNAEYIQTEGALGGGGKPYVDQWQVMIDGRREGRLHEGWTQPLRWAGDRELFHTRIAATMHLRQHLESHIEYKRGEIRTLEDLLKGLE